MMEQEIYRHVPYDIDVEQAVLGSLLVDNALIDIVASDLEPEHFYDPLHGRLYEMIVYLQTEGVVAPLILHAVMKNDPGLMEVGGLAYLAALAQAAPALPNIREYAKLLVELATRRALIRIGEDMINAAYSAPRETSAHTIGADASDAILDASDNRKNITVSLGAAMAEAINHAIVHAGKDEQIRGIRTGIEKIDVALGGLHPGDRIAIGGRSGMGKSLLASVFANGAALGGYPVYIASGDMRKEQWSARSACELAQAMFPMEPPIPYSKFRKGGFTSGEIERLIAANEAMMKMPILIDDNPKISLPGIRGRARALARRHKGKQGLIIVDFLQNVEPPQRRGYKDRRRDEDITQIAYDLGNIARDLGWAIVSLVQLKNKDSDLQGQVAMHPPSVADVRESGGIEQAVDVLLGIYRPAFAIEHNSRKSWTEKRAEIAELHVESGIQLRHLFQTLGFKNRDASSLDLDLNLWCDMSCGAIRDEKPYRPDEADQAAADLYGAL